MNWTTAQLANLYKARGEECPVELACGDGTKKLSKYRAQPTTVDGIRFDSKREAQHYGVLKLANERGFITSLKLQPRFLLLEKRRRPDGKMQRAISYVADFSFIRDAALVVVDVKGIETPAFKLKLKLFHEKYPDLNLEIWK